MSFFDAMFKSTPAAPVNPTPTAPAPITEAPAPGELSAPKDLADPSKSAENPPNPLDEYKKMFDTSATNSDIASPNFKLDQEVLTKVTNSMDFTKGVDPALMEKALGGDAKSVMEVMQQVGRNSYRSSLEHTASLTDAHLTNRAAYEAQQLNKGVKTQLTQNELSSVPNYSHPVVKAELNRVAESFQRANPDATPPQVAKAAQKYMQDLQLALNPNAPPEEPGAGGPVDWSAYLK